MSLSTSFELLSFQRKVQDALQVVERTLELERKPRLAGDVDHAYGAKFGLVNSVTNTAIIAYLNCFEKLGLDMGVLTSIDKTKPTTLRFEASISPKFLKEKEMEVPLAECTWNETEETNKGDSSSTTTTTKSGVKKVSGLFLMHYHICMISHFKCTKIFLHSILHHNIHTTPRSSIESLNFIGK